MKTYQITYKNTLHSNKSRKDYEDWLNKYWPKQKTWGASSVRIWDLKENGKTYLMCSYTIENLNKWTKRNMGKEAVEIGDALRQVIDLNQLSIKITPND